MEVHFHVNLAPDPEVNQEERNHGSPFQCWPQRGWRIYHGVTPRTTGGDLPPARQKQEQ